MLVGTVRNRLTRNDAQLVLHVLSHGSRDTRELLERVLRDEGIDALLDDPQLADGLLHQDQGSCASLPLFIYVMVRRTLNEQGETDRAIADFVSAIVFQFGFKDRARQIREHDDVRYDALVDLLADAECADPTRAFLARAHLGNRALWMAGLFPDWIEERHRRRGGPRLDYFDDMGRQGYLLAAHHRLAEQHGVVEFFEKVGERFGHLRVALNRMSDRVLFPRYHSADKLMRQVRDEARWH